MSFSVTPRGGAFTGRGGWNAKTVYYQDDFVVWNGIEYQSLLPFNQGNQPDLTGFAWTPSTQSLGPDSTVYLGMAVTKEAPVFVTHPDFAGGADMTGASLSDAAMVSCLNYAKTAGATGAAAEVFVPSGKMIVSSQVQFGNINRIRFFGEGSTSFIQQQTDNVPILEWNAGGTSVQGVSVDHLRLEHLNQQTAGSQPLGVAISLLSTNVNGFFYNLFDFLMFNQSARGIQWGNGSSQLSFWNNTLRDLTFFSMGGAILRSASSVAVGGPVNHVERITTLGPFGTPSEPALALGGTAGTTGGGQWDMSSVDIEDWVDTAVSCTGGGILAIRGLHLERHHMVTAFGVAVNIGSVNTQGVFDGGVLAWRLDGAGPFVGFNFASAQGSVNGMRNRKDPASSGAGQLRLVAADANSMVTLGTYANEDAQIVPYNPNAIPLPGIRSDGGLPPILTSGVALPAASATYDGLLLRYNGQTTAIPDRLVYCRHDGLNVYSWVDLSPVRSGVATLASGNVTIADTRITANSLIRVTNIGPSGTLGPLNIVLNAGSQFGINSVAGDNSKVFWEIVSY